MPETETVEVKAIETLDAEAAEAAEAEKPKLACPETKKPRDECIMENGEENCGDLIEAHKQCMRALGFKI